MGMVYYLEIIMYSKKKKTTTKNPRVCLVPVFERTPKMCFLKTLLCFLNLVFFLHFLCFNKKNKLENKHVVLVILIFENIKQFLKTVNKQTSLTSFFFSQMSLITNDENIGFDGYIGTWILLISEIYR